MALCVDYQPVYSRRDTITISVRMQLVAALLLLFSLVLRVWVKIESTDVGYELARERQRQVQLDSERRELELHRTVMLRSDYLFRRAKKELALRPLDPKQARRIVTRHPRVEVSL